MRRNSPRRRKGNGLVVIVNERRTRLQTVMEMQLHILTNIVFEPG
jgi:hypothetical protein